MKKLYVVGLMLAATIVSLGYAIDESHEYNISTIPAKNHGDREFLCHLHDTYRNAFKNGYLVAQPYRDTAHFLRRQGQENLAKQMDLEARERSFQLIADLQQDMQRHLRERGY